MYLVIHLRYWYVSLTFININGTMIGKISSFTDVLNIRIFDVYSAIALDQEMAQNGESRLENKYSGTSL